MIPAAHRLKKAADFQRVFQTAGKQKFGPLLFFVAPAFSNQWRIGIVVSKKVSNKAVVRNKIRRNLAAQFHQVQSTLDSLPAHDTAVMVLYQPDNLQTEFTQAVKKWLENLLLA